MTATNPNNSVWVGFVGDVPVVGTVKESVALVMALYEENKDVVNEKQRAIAELLRLPESPSKPKPLAEPEPLMEPMKGLKLPEIPEGGTEDPEGAAGTSASARLDLKEVKLEELSEYVCSVRASKKTNSKIQEESL